jgi:hypothetical protein
LFGEFGKGGVDRATVAPTSKGWFKHRGDTAWKISKIRSEKGQALLKMAVFRAVVAAGSARNPLGPDQRAAKIPAWKSWPILF